MWNFTNFDRRHHLTNIVIDGFSDLPRNNFANCDWTALTNHFGSHHCAVVGFVDNIRTPRPFGCAEAL